MKASPVVITTLLLLMLILVAPAAATTRQADSQTRLTALTSRSDALHAQIARLAKKARGHRHDATFSRRVVRVNRKVIRVNAVLARLSDEFLEQESDDTTAADALIAGNRLALHMGRDAIRLDHRSLHARSRRVTRLVLAAAINLSSANAQLKGWRWNKPQPTPTPTPTPTVTPTVTPTPTPTPTTSGPAVPAGYTLIANQTINNLQTSGLHDRYYYRCTFTGGSATSAVVTLTSAHDLIFDSSTIATGGGWNGVSVNDQSGSVNDITFKNMLFKAQGRMGIEITSRPTTAVTGYQRIDIIASTFEPQGNEAVSYDGGPAAGGSLFSGNLIEGAGNDPAQAYGAGLEINGPSDMTVTDNVIWQCRGAAFNLQRHVTAASGWVVTGNLLDASHHFQSVAMRAAAQQVGALGVYGGVFARNTVISAAPGGSVAYFSDSHDMDWRTTTWRDADGRSGYATPTQTGGSSGIQL